MVEKIIIFWVQYPRSLQKHRERCIRKNITCLILQIVESVNVVLFFTFIEKLYLRKKEKMRSTQKEKNKHDKMLNKHIAIINSFSLLLKGKICHAGWKTKTIKFFRDKAKQNNIS